MSTVIHPDHYYVPKAENDPVRTEVHGIFTAAIEPYMGDATFTLEQIRVGLQDRIDRMLKEAFPSKHAQPTVDVGLTHDQGKPFFLIAAIVYGHSFSATLG